MPESVMDRGPPARVDAQIGGMESEVLAIADTEMPGNMFVFVRYPHMDSANLAERALRPAVVFRKVRGKMATPGDIKMFATLKTCLLTGTEGA